MSDAYEFTKRALAQFQQLDPWLAEETLDELEELIQNPPTSRLKSPAGAIHDFVRVHEGRRAYVFLTISSYPAREVFRVTTIGVHMVSS